MRGPQNVFVNRRIVKDRTIAHAISEAYSVATIKERSPEVHLFIEIPPDRVDVNVHPTKAEVRFLEQALVHEVLRRALGDALGQGPRAGAAVHAVRATAAASRAPMSDPRRPGRRDGRQPVDCPRRARACRRPRLGAPRWPATGRPVAPTLRPGGAERRRRSGR